MKLRNLILSALALAALLTATAPAQEQELLTRAEASNYTETSRNADVLAFARELAARSPLVRLTYIGHAASGDPIPLLIVGNPAPATAAEMLGDPRLRVYIQANIHPGEVEGKEASLMLARDIALGDRGALLDNLVILIVPNLNAGGNEKISPENRHYQGGPEGGVGVRPNDQNLDLNRDWMKLETPEVTAVVRHVLSQWDPALVIDCHTTNGSPHRHPLTYAPSHNATGDREVALYTRDVLLPDAVRVLRDDFGYDPLPYGNFTEYLEPAQGAWTTFGQEPRYTNNYIGLRNRLSVLIETYAFADFPTRVRSTYGFLVGQLRHCSANRDAIKELIAAADGRARARAAGLEPERDRVVNAVELQALPEPIQVKSYEMEQYEDQQGRRRARPTETETVYELPYYGHFEPTGTIPMPAAYLVPKTLVEIVDKLRQHGICVQRLTRDVEADALRFLPTEMSAEERAYQGHRFVTVQGHWLRATESVEAGTFVICTAQPLGALAAYLLEPESDDGLLKWNFFDRYLSRQWGRGYLPYPVLKIMEPGPLPLEAAVH